MNPYQHGEVYVTDDGAETDLDLGMNGLPILQPLVIIMSRPAKFYHSVITKERRGDYLGGNRSGDPAYN